MRRGAPAELVSLDQTLETFAFRVRGDVHDLTGAEDLSFDLLAGFEAVVTTNLDHVAVRLEARLLELAKLALAELALGDDAEGDAGRGVTVFLRGAEPEYSAGAGFEHCYRRGGAVCVNEA